MLEVPPDPSAVVSLDGWRRKLDREKKGGCKHERYILDTEAGVVNCAECDAPVSAFYALKKIAYNESQAYRYLYGLKAEIAEIKGRRSWLKSVRELDRQWRGKSMLPCCKHCGRGLFAEEIGISSVGISYEIARRKRDGERVPSNEASGIAAPGGDETAQQAQPEGQEPGGEAETPKDALGDRGAPISNPKD